MAAQVGGLNSFSPAGDLPGAGLSAENLKVVPRAGAAVFSDSHFVKSHRSIANEKAALPGLALTGGVHAICRLDYRLNEILSSVVVPLMAGTKTTLSRTKFTLLVETIKVIYGSLVLLADLFFKEVIQATIEDGPFSRRERELLFRIIFYTVDLVFSKAAYEIVAGGEVFGLSIVRRPRAYSAGPLNRARADVLTVSFCQEFCKMYLSLTPAEVA